MPSANGHAPELLDDPMMASFVSYLHTKYHSKLVHIYNQLDPKSTPNPASWSPKIHDLGPKLGIGRTLGGVLEGLGWVLGPKMARKPLNAQICKQKLRLLGAKLGPQIVQNWSQERPEV